MKKPPPPTADEKPVYFKVVGQNRRARHDYHIEETVEAGIELHGSEVKSLRTGKVNFADSFARVDGNQCWLHGLQIGTYERAHVQIPEPARPRRLLLHQREIEKLRTRSDRTGRTLIPLEIYFRGSWAKIKLGVAKGKTFGDKRQVLREQQERREIDRTLKSSRRR